MKRTTILQFITSVTLVVTVFQGMIPSMPIDDKTLVSVIAMYLVATLTAWKQYISTKIDNSSILLTIVLGILATIGGLNDLINLIHIPDVLGQWLRFVITASAALLNILSHKYFPSPVSQQTINK